MAVGCQHELRIDAFSRDGTQPIPTDRSKPCPTNAATREPELLTITEAAELLRAPVATLRYWRHLGTVP